MNGGWFIGDFTPVVWRTREFEVGVKFHPIGSDWPAHYQKRAWEINLVEAGSLRIGETTYDSGDIFVIRPGQVVKPEFLTHTVVVCVKVPSLPKDKVVVDAPKAA